MLPGAADWERFNNARWHPEQNLSHKLPPVRDTRGSAGG
jgi:hypothetical protein